MSMTIGVDPHKASHTAVAIDGDEHPLARVTVTADRGQTQRLLAWAEPLGVERTWAIECATGLGRLLAQQLVAAGENVVDVPPILAARVRLLGSTKASKNDPNDALATAIAGLRHCGLRAVAVDDHTAVLRMLADRHEDLTSLRTQAACRLHAVLRELLPGGAPLRLSADRAGLMLRGVRTEDVVAIERKRLARDHLVDIRRLDRDIAAMRARITDAVISSGTTLTDLYGVGPITAALILGQVGDPARFRTRHQFASYNGTAPIEASSGPRVRHRLNPRGNRTLNHAVHMIAVTQIGHDTPGRAYYLRRQAEGKTPKEALRALKRRVSDTVWRQLQVDLANR
ncbi:MAG: IS110 family transposase [Actinomycetota bacterium]|nr:IS110 family transposase [Actinomycetota bacterium]